MKRINVYVREEDHTWLKKVAKAHDRPIAQLIRLAIEDFRLREAQPLGIAYVPIDFDSPECVPSKEEKTLKGQQERLEKLEKFVFDKVTLPLSLDILMLETFAPITAPQSACVSS